MYDYVIDDFFINSAVAGGLAILAVFLIAVLIVVLVMLVFGCIGVWKTLEKAGKPGWGALIPYYNSYLLCEVSGVNPFWVLAVVIIGALGIVIPGVLSVIHFFGIITFGLKTILSIVSFGASVYFSVILGISVARSFGKSDAFGVGLILLPFVFYFILGISKDKYLGPKPMEDKVFEYVNDNFDLGSFGNFSSTQEAKAEFVKKCPYCGGKVNEKAKFCSKCGSKL